jgi:riboflavin synthase
MFTGIVTDVGTVRELRQAGDTGFVIETAYDTARIDIGASICCSGACLTVTEKGPGWFAVTGSAETLACTNLSEWQAGTRVNLERALKVGDELGGHIVSGHVDCVGVIHDIRPEGDSLRIVVEVPDDVAHYFAPKGSVAIDGVSLTVNEVDGNRFGINVIPHTQQMTTFSALKEGQRVNIEVDLLARYVARLMERNSA